MRVPINGKEGEEGEVRYEVSVDNLESDTVIVQGSQTYKLTVKHIKE